MQADRRNRCRRKHPVENQFDAALVLAHPVVETSDLGHDGEVRVARRQIRLLSGRSRELTHICFDVGPILNLGADAMLLVIVGSRKVTEHAGFEHLHLLLRVLKRELTVMQ